MGSVGFTMPLLSTLAALVIIVHSAEEDYDREYRLTRSRPLDAQINYDQPWRIAETGPPMTQSSEIMPRETWDATGPEQLMKPRRARKRKRRPLIDVDEVPQERVYTYKEDSLPHRQQNIERPRRQRKKMDQNSDDKEKQNTWNAEVNRPKRRRGHKRKRPLVETLPELSEFGGYRERKENSEETTDDKELQPDKVYEEERNNQKEINEKVNAKVQINNKNISEMEKTTQPMSNNVNEPQATAKDDSMSEFSIESRNPNEMLERTTIDLEQKTKEIGLSNNIEPSKDVEPLDPLALKALLKKSNGRSLSEILQQNNLSLTDLLQGRKKALSILKKETLPGVHDMSQSRHSNTVINSPISAIGNNDNSNKMEFSNSEKNEPEQVEITTLTTTENIYNNNGYEDSVEHNYQENEPVETHRRDYILMRRFPGGFRRKLRTTPTANIAFKDQLSRDLIALTSLKYKNNKNISKSREWKEILPSMMKAELSLEAETTVPIETELEILTTTPCTIPETTNQEIFETTTDPSYTATNTELTTDFKDQSDTTAESKSTYLEIEGIEIAQFTTTPLDVKTEQEKEVVTRKPKPLSIKKPFVNSSDMRRQALNNRLKRKRLKQRTTTTEIPEELEVEDTFGIGISASEFNTKTQTRTTADENDFTTFEDIVTTEATRKISGRYRSKKPSRTKNNTSSSIQKLYVTTEETAKYEIEEILSDNHTSEQLSKILQERNMTLEELVEHRERGSSHVHLADIFHNASREPNPPEPFLSKSLIEPISKETYPLRALLEANLHDPRTTTIDPTAPQINANIPVVMDFGNNVNENGENKGVISLFNNYSKTGVDKTNSNHEEIRNYDTEKLNNQGIGTSRDARMLNYEKDSVTWHDLISLMQRSSQKGNRYSETLLDSDTPVSETIKKIDIEEDLDRDGLIVLNDLQQLQNMERKTSQDNLLNLRNYERNKPLASNSNTVLSDTKSVTVATASIIGLALILFLLTYAILKWKQQNKLFHTKRAKEDNFVPSPVFENRKSQKINSSTRSKSPMLATPNIYSIDTIDARAGSESPEYMWDTLRKPFQ